VIEVGADVHQADADGVISLYIAGADGGGRGLMVVYLVFLLRQSTFI